MRTLLSLGLALPALVLAGEATAQPGAADPSLGAPDDCSTGWLPTGHLFPTLRADPLAARFAGAAGYLESEERLLTTGREDIPFGLASLGGTLGLYRDGGCDGLQVSVAAGAVSIFELEPSESTLLNTDFRVAVPIELRRGMLSARLRLAHQSSHLGDELLLGNPGLERDDLSYEWVDGAVAVGDERWRLYGGGGTVLHSVEDLDRKMLFGGLEVGGTSRGIQPTAAVHWQTVADQPWSGTVNVHAGVALVADERLELVATYLRGASPYSQYFTGESVEILGVELRGGL